MKNSFTAGPSGKSIVPVLGVLFVALGLGVVAVTAQPGGQSANKLPLTWKQGHPETGAAAVQKTMAEIMANPAAQKHRAYIYIKPEFKVPWREHRPQDPDALPVVQYPAPEASKAVAQPTHTPQPIGLSFDTLTGPGETGAFPPDTMGCTGPTQFIVAVNGLIRTFTKAGVADGVMNVNTDVFFAPVLTPLGGGIGCNFTTDPQIRYDRLSGRWFIMMGDVPLSDCSSPTATLFPNRIMIAVSDTSTITNSTVWSLYYFQQNTVGGGDTNDFADYPSLGIDNLALYIGTDRFDAGPPANQNYNGTDGFVVRKSSVLSGGPIVVTAFRQLATAAGEGPFAPRGVDNFDPSSNEGYFIGVSNLAFGRLDIRRVSNPGGTPSISSNLLLTVTSTSFAIAVDHSGNNDGTDGRLDGVDDNLFAAHIRNGRLWTAHGIAVTSSGVASNTNANRRNALRWYELNGVRSIDNGGTPVVVQSGTLYNSTSSVSDARQFWLPTTMVTGQGHAAFGFSTAGTPYFADAATIGRLRGDAPGTPSGSIITGVSIYTSSSTAYNPSGDTPASGQGPRRWGDYSFTSLDPLDDQTIWTIQEYCNGSSNGGTYGCKVAKLLAPPPATPASASPNSIASGQPSVIVTITGTSVNGSEFYDPGTNLPAPAVPFNHISATVTGGVTVNSVTYNSATSVTLDLNTTGATPGSKDVTIINPDGQSMTGTGLITVTGAAPFTLNSGVSRKTHAGAGTFEINLPLSGEPGLESRSTGGNHTLVFTFSNNVVSGNAVVILGTGTVGGTSFSANTMTVNLTGVTNAQRITVRLSNVTDEFNQVLPNTDVSMNVLAGDVNANKAVNAADVSATKSSLGSAPDATTFRRDVNTNGTINAADVAIVKQNLGTGVP